MMHVCYFVNQMMQNLENQHKIEICALQVISGLLGTIGYLEEWRAEKTSMQFT